MCDPQAALTGKTFFLNKFSYDQSMNLEFPITINQFTYWYFPYISL